MEEKYLEEDEIDLMDYIKVILKRKTFILALFLTAVITAGIFSFLLPKVYKIEVVLKVGQVVGSQIESPAQLVEKISRGVYGEYPKLKADNPKRTRLVLIATETSKIQEAKDVLNKIIDLILKEHEKKFTEKFAVLEEEIVKTEEELKFLKSSKTYTGEGIAQLQTQLSNKKIALINSEMTEVIKAPTVSKEPLAPKPLLNMAIAGILGLFLGIFLAFLENGGKKVKI